MRERSPRSATDAPSPLPSPRQEPAKPSGLEWPRNAIFFVVAFLIPICVLHAVYTRLAAALDAASARGELAGGATALHLPRSVEDVKQIQHVLHFLVAAQFELTLFGFATAYLFKQTFSIPGSAALNVLCGAVWGAKVGIPLACLLTATGASCCFSLSRVCAGRFAQRQQQQQQQQQLAGEKLENKQGRFASTLRSLRERSERVQRQEGALALTLYLASLRMFPGTPQWALNAALPHCGVPVGVFFASTLLGLAPYTAVTVGAGGMLGTVDSLRDLFDARLMAALAAAAVALAALPKVAAYVTANVVAPTDRRTS